MTEDIENSLEDARMLLAAQAHFPCRRNIGSINYTSKKHEFEKKLITDSNGTTLRIGCVHCGLCMFMKPSDFEELVNRVSK